MRAAALALALAALVPGCAFDDACTRDPTYAYADVPLAPFPDDATLDAALNATGWRKMPPGPGAYATAPLADGWEVVLHLGIPEDRVANGHGLFIAARESLVHTEEESAQLLSPVVDPLSRALGSGPVIYYGGIEHCDD